MFTWAKNITNLNTVHALRTLVAGEGEDEKGNLLFTSDPIDRTQFA